MVSPMTWSRWTPIACVAVLGCARAPIAVDDAAQDSGSGSGGSDAGQLDDGDDHGGGDGGGTAGDGDGPADDTTADDDAATADDDGGDETGDTGGEPSSCLAADGSLARVALRWDSAEDRAWLHGEGGELELAIDAPANDTVWILAAASEDRVVVGRNTGGFDREQSASLHAFTRDGQPQWSVDLESATIGRLHVGAGGAVSAVTGWTTEGGSVGFALTQPDDAIVFPEHHPLAAPRDGLVAAQQVLASGEGGPVGWLSLADGSWQPANPVALQPYSVWVDADDLTLEYLAVDGSDPRFVRATPDGATSIELPTDSLPSTTLSAVARAGDYRLLQSSSDDGSEDYAFLRIDVQTDEVVVVAPEPPSGWSWFDCYFRRAVVDVDGAVLFELRDDTRARVWAFDPDDEQWSEAGLPTTEVDDLEFQGSGGAVHVVRGMGQGTTFCPPVEWAQAGREAIAGSSLQVLRRDPPLAMTVSPLSWEVRIDATEQCAAFADEIGWHVVPLDDDGWQIDAGPSEGWLWLP